MLAHLDWILPLLPEKHPRNHAEPLRIDFDPTLELVGCDPDQPAHGIESDISCASQHLLARRRKPRKYRKSGVRLTWSSSGSSLHKVPQSISGACCFLSTHVVRVIASELLVPGADSLYLLFCILARFLVLGVVGVWEDGQNGERFQRLGRSRMFQGF